MSAPRSPYLDPVLYDAVYSRVGDDIPFYVELAQAAGGPVLEVGCGSGRVLIPTLEAGVEIHGLDREPAMLSRLRDKAAAKGLATQVFEGDMRDFTMPGRYRLVTSPFRAFMHLESTEDQIQALRCIREHLEPGGLLAFNVFYPSADQRRDKHGVRDLLEVTHPESGRPVQVFDVSRFDNLNQTVTVEREVVEDDGHDRVVTRSSFTLRWVYRFELELLLLAAGFTGVEILGGFDRRPLERDTDEMVVLARKN